MKTRPIAFSVFFICHSVFLWAQVFPTQDATWELQSHGFLGTAPVMEVMCGDTMINSQLYQKIFRLNLDKKYKIESQSLLGMTRVDGRKVWAIEAGKSDEFLLYDFELEQGDTIRLKTLFFDDGTHLYEVGTIDSVEVGGLMKKRFQMISGTRVVDYWVEGVGSNDGGFHRGYDTFDYGLIFRCFKVNNVLFYQNPEFEIDFENKGYTCKDGKVQKGELEFGAEVMPNPARDRFSVRLPAHSPAEISGQLFDAWGRLVQKSGPFSEKLFEVNTSNLSAGIYFFRLVDANKNLSLQHFKIIVQ